MLTQKEIDKIMFFAIETTSAAKDFTSLPVKLQKCFQDRFKTEIGNPKEMSEKGISFNSAITFSEKAALYPEFGKIIAISWGGLIPDGSNYAFKSGKIASDNEIEVLTLFADKLSKIVRKGGQYPFALCGFSAKGFNIPFLNKRLLINGIQLPEITDIEGVKPWELNHIIDVSQEWKMGSYDSYTSFETICALFDVEFEAKNNISSLSLEEIEAYSESKVTALAKLYLKLKLNSATVTKYVAKETV